jgi:hypothetical protein
MLLDASNALKHIKTNTKLLTYSHLCSVICRHAQTVTAWDPSPWVRDIERGYGASAPNFDPTAWWLMYGGDCKKLQTIARHVLGLTPSSCHAGRFFSEQKNTLTTLRSRLGHEKIVRPMFTTSNLRLLNHLDTTEFFDDVLSAVQEDQDACEHSGPVE